MKFGTGIIFEKFYRAKVIFIQNGPLKYIIYVEA